MKMIRSINKSYNFYCSYISTGNFGGLFAEGQNGILTLYPYAEIPFSDKWIFEDKVLLEKFKQENKVSE